MACAEEGVDIFEPWSEVTRNFKEEFVWEVEQVCSSYMNYFAGWGLHCLRVYRARDGRVYGGVLREIV